MFGEQGWMDGTEYRGTMKDLPNLPPRKIRADPSWRRGGDRPSNLSAPVSPPECPCTSTCRNAPLGRFKQGDLVRERVVVLIRTGPMGGKLGVETGRTPP